MELDTYKAVMIRAMSETLGGWERERSEENRKCIMTKLSRMLISRSVTISMPALKSGSAQNIGSAEEVRIQS